MSDRLELAKHLRDEAMFFDGRDLPATAIMLRQAAALLEQTCETCQHLMVDGWCALWTPMGKVHSAPVKGSQILYCGRWTPKGEV